MANTHCGYVVEIKELRKHSNADKLQVATIFGQNVIVGLDVKVGDIGVFFPSDNQLSEEFCKENKLLRSLGGYIEDSTRAVKAVRLRGERSEGIYLPISSLATFCNCGDLLVGDEVGNDFYGHDICHKYIPKHVAPSEWHMRSKVKKKKQNDTPDFAEHVDTAQLDYNYDQFHEGDDVEITLKLDGTSARTAYTTILEKKSWFRKLFHLPAKSHMGIVSGTRRTVIDWNGANGGFYGTHAFRKPYHDALAKVLKPNQEVFYEIVGYYGEGTEDTIMAIRKTSKTGDKELVKRYGENMAFTYGCKPGENHMYVYRITENGRDYSPEEIEAWCARYGFDKVPTIERFTYTTEEDMRARINNYFSDLTDPIGKTHIKEGIVARIVNHSGFDVYKTKTFEYKMLCNLRPSEQELAERAKYLDDDALEEG